MAFICSYIAIQCYYIRNLVPDIVLFFTKKTVFRDIKDRFGDKKDRFGDKKDRFGVTQNGLFVIMDS